MGDYNYKLDVFEGPLDLLLHLIEKHKIEITDIPIVEITSQYLEYLDNWNHFDIHYSSEFLVMASTLLQIKSRMLLPKAEPEPEDAEDPRDEFPDSSAMGVHASSRYTGCNNRLLPAHLP